MTWAGYTQPPDWWRTRARILRRDPNCRLGYDCCTRTSTTVDHRVPVSQGGGHEDSNLQGVCVPCHAVKSEREKLEGMARKSRRRAPRRHPSDPGG